MKPTVYIETSVVSYLTARPTNDPILAGQIAATAQWWNATRPQCDLFTSRLVIEEAAAGYPDAAARRLAALAGIPELPITGPARQLSAALLAAAALPPTAAADSLHLATAALNGMDYLLTWNCRHLANATLRTRIEQVCRDQGYEPPVICTPPELFQVVP